jgi:hypothetical protein
MKNEKITSADMNDEDIKRLGPLYAEIMQMFARKEMTLEVAREIEKVAIDRFHKLGYVARVHTAERLMNLGPVTIEILGHVAGSEFEKYGLDHERKQHDILRGIERNEDKDVRRIIKAIE